MEVSVQNNNNVPNLAIQRRCSKKKFIIPLLIIKALNVIFCIIVDSMKVKDIEEYSDNKPSNTEIPSGIYGINYKKDDDLSELKENEDLFSTLALTPSIISFVLVILLSLHFFFEDRCCCGKSGCLYEFHVVICMMINFFTGLMNLIISGIDYGSYFNLENGIIRIFDLIIIITGISTYFFFLIIGCYLYRENNICSLDCSRCRYSGTLCSCDCDCCKCNLCDLGNCCFGPKSSFINSSNSSTNNPQIQQPQQNILVVSNYRYPDNQNYNKNEIENDLISGRNNLNNLNPVNGQTSIRTVIHNDKINKGNKKIIKEKERRKSSKEIGCIKDKYSERYKNIIICTICNTNFKYKDNILLLPCKHIYHRQCAINCFKQNNNKCPIDGKVYNM